MWKEEDYNSNRSSKRIWRGYHHKLYIYIYIHLIGWSIEINPLYYMMMKKREIQMKLKKNIQSIIFFSLNILIVIIISLNLSLYEYHHRCYYYGSRIRRKEVLFFPVHIKNSLSIILEENRKESFEIIKLKYQSDSLFSNNKNSLDIFYLIFFSSLNSFCIVEDSLLCSNK